MADRMIPGGRYNQEAEVNVLKTIQDIRKRTGLSQNQFSDALHIPRPSLKKWEQGQRECPPYVVELIEYRVQNDPIFHKGSE